MSPYQNAVEALQRPERFIGEHDVARAYLAEAPSEEIKEYENTPQPVLVRLSDVQPEEVHWIWPGRIAKGKLSLVIGDPGNGKSTALLDVACRITSGAEWPDGGRAESGSVLILTAEDGLADTVRPRVDLHGGDPARIHSLKAIKVGEDERPFSLASDLPYLEAPIRTLRDVRLIIVDPLSAYLGDKDTYKDSEIRSVLSPLAALSERHKVAIVAILHLTKGDQRKALYRALGSVAFVAASRTVFAVGRDTENPDRRIFVCVKNNIAPHPPALAFSIIEQAGRGILRWEEQPIVEVDADSVLSMSLSASQREEHQDAEEFLQELLADGQVTANYVFQAGRQNGFSEPTLKRAKKRLGIQAIKVGQPGERGKWYWCLPKGITDPPKSINFDEVIPFDETKDARVVSSTSSSKGITNGEMISFGKLLREEFEV